MLFSWALISKDYLNPRPDVQDEEINQIFNHNLMIKRKPIVLFIKILVIVGSFGFIGFKIQNQIISGQFLGEFKQIDSGSYLFAGLAVLLVFFNWGIEALKWQRLINPLQTIRFGRSFRAILAGITVSVFTPNRVGEFGGRIVVLDRTHRIQAIFATILGGFSQLLVTLLGGLVALPIYFYWFPKQNLISNSHAVIFIGGIIAVGIGLWMFFRSGYIVQRLKEYLKKKQWVRFIDFISWYKISDLVHVWFLSILRYLVFSLQFYLLLRFFGIDAHLLSMIVAIASVYLVMTVIPTVAVAEFGIRGSVAVYFMSVFTPYVAGIVSASMLLWIINLAIPALVGSVIIAKTRI